MQITINHQALWSDYPLGVSVVGYRYGDAPECGYSINYASGESEPGVSMASVGTSPESKSFATIEAKEGRKVYYYRGLLAGAGSDDELCLTDCVKITEAEYTRGRLDKISEQIGQISINRKIWGALYTLANDLHNIRHASWISDESRKERISAAIATIRRLYGDTAADTAEQHIKIEG